MSFDDEFPYSTFALNHLMPNRGVERAYANASAVIERLGKRLGFADLFEYFATFEDNKRVFSEFEDSAVGFADNLKEGLDSLTSEDEDSIKGVVLTFLREINPKHIELFLDCTVADMVQYCMKALEYSFLAAQLFDFFHRTYVQYPDKQTAMASRLIQFRQEFEEQGPKVMTIMGLLEDLEHAKESEVGRRVLKAIADLAELRYQTYANLLNDLFTIVGRIKPCAEQRPAFGVCADRVQRVMERDYPDYAHLFDKDFVKVRNAVVHSGINLVTTRPPTFELRDRNKEGKEWTLKLTNKAIRWRWEEIDDAVGIDGYVPVAIDAMCGRILLNLSPELRALISQDPNTNWPKLKALLPGE